jgi:hypothetical protein
MSVGCSRGQTYLSGRAEALRQAQLGMLASPDRAHPRYWASFIVSGDERSMERRPVDPSFGRVKPGAGGCGACEIGVAQQTGGFGWLGVFIAGALFGIRRRYGQLRGEGSRGEAGMAGGTQRPEERWHSPVKPR